MTKDKCTNCGIPTTLTLTSSNCRSIALTQLLCGRCYQIIEATEKANTSSYEKFKATLIKFGWNEEEIEEVRQENHSF